MKAPLTSALPTEQKKNKNKIISLILMYRFTAMKVIEGNRYNTADCFVICDLNSKTCSCIVANSPVCVCKHPVNVTHNIHLANCLNYTCITLLLEIKKP